MPDPTPREIASRYTRRAFSVLRVAAGLAASADADVARLGRQLQRIVASEDLAELGRRDLSALLREIDEAIAAAYASISSVQAEAARELLGIEAGWAAGVLGSTEPRESMIDRLARGLLVLGAPPGEQWTRQGDALGRRVGDLVREAAAGTPGSVRDAVSDALAIARRDAQNLADLTANSAAAQGRAEVARASGAVGFRWLSILDMNTTTGCAIRHGLVYSLDLKPIGHNIPIERPPPRHWGCRSMLAPLLRMPREGDRDEGTFDDWLATLSDDEAADVLGKGRADLYRRKVITKADLVNQRGRVLTLKELRARGD